MTDKLNIVLAQLNPVVGDIAGNIEKAKAAHGEAARLGADLVVFSELFITGYPPEDLVLKPAFARAAREAAEGLAEITKEGAPGILIGTVWAPDNAPARLGNEAAAAPSHEAALRGGSLQDAEVSAEVYNAAVLLDAGKVAGVRFKVELPNYGVFDEKRVFDPGPMPGPLNFRGVRIGVPICEDIWFPDVCECLEETGAELLIVPNGSPFDISKPDLRLNVAVSRVTETGLPLIYVNQLGGQDELVFDGASFVLGSDCRVPVQLPDWREAVVATHWERQAGSSGGSGWICAEGERAHLLEGDAAIYQACVLGLRDYVDKTGFPSVVLGLSGGIDSALVAALCVDALGADRVHAIMLPYKYTSSESLADAARCAEALGLRYDIVPIEGVVESFTDALAELFAGTAPDVTEENIQSRTRGTILMAVSNKFGGMVVTTGNKSEMSVGYATLYGDMNGGFNPIKDLYKLKVYELARWRNDNLPLEARGPAGEVIPENIITKAPTAELREGQTDQDSLPPYEVLDDVLECLVEKELSLPEIIARGHPADTVKRIAHLLYVAEYKRRQAAPGTKITSRNFGRDRRYPIQNRFRETV